MADGRRLGKGILVKALQDREGYSLSRANKAVNTVVEVMKKALREGKNVEIEGLGTLRIVSLPQRRYVHKQLIGMEGKPSVVSAAKHKKTIRLKASLRMEPDA